MKLAVLAVVALLAAPVHADPICAAEADQLRAHLEVEQSRTFRWNLAWAILFGGAAAGQLTLALTETKPFGTFDEKTRDTLYVGAGKATLGLATRVIMPLRVSIPEAREDRCAELLALRASVTAIAKKERRTFWLTHLGGTALNLAAAGFLWHRHSFKTGAVSFAMSYPVGLLSAYTLPRRSWGLWRAQRASWAVGVSVAPEQTVFSISGEM